MEVQTTKSELSENSGAETIQTLVSNITQMTNLIADI